MRLTRRDSLRAAGAAMATFTLGMVTRGNAGTPPAPDALRQAQPGGLLDTKLRTIAELPLTPNGSAVEYPPERAGTISEPTLWRYTDNQTPAIEFDYRKSTIKVDNRGTATRGGTLTLADLDLLPKHSQVVLLQCASPNPRGIVKWTGVRFAEIARMLGVQPFAHYCRVVGSDRYWVEEEMQTMLHPQTMLAWMLNDEPIPPRHGAPMRLIIPFRYGGRSVKAVTEIYFSSNVFDMPRLP
ncbi:MAG: molybdopterin-dependent oxidoreductase [Acidobacteria bacterium]|nr:molybdopterin-dependent oxidoreductase [Acidobacteriota bacterium]